MRTSASASPAFRRSSSVAATCSCLKTFFVLHQNHCKCTKKTNQIQENLLKKRTISGGDRRTGIPRPVVISAAAAPVPSQPPLPPSRHFVFGKMFSVMTCFYDSNRFSRAKTIFSLFRKLTGSWIPCRKVSRVAFGTPAQSVGTSSPLCPAFPVTFNCKTMLDLIMAVTSSPSVWVC